MKALKLILAASTFAAISANACPFSEGKITASKASQEQKIAQLTGGTTKPAITAKAQPQQTKGTR